MSLCYDFQKWTMITLSSIAITMIIGLVGLAYGQSLDELEKQVNQTVSYRAELIDYIESHNMTLTRDANLMETDSLERIVKKHMEDCKSGAREEQKKLLEEVFGKQDNLSGIFGGC